MRHQPNSKINYYSSDKELIIFIEGLSPITIINSGDDNAISNEDLIFTIEEYNNVDTTQDKEFYYSLIKEMIFQS